MKASAANNEEKNQRNKLNICVLKETASSLGEAIKQSRKKVQKLCQTSQEILAGLSNEDNIWKMTLDERFTSLEKEWYPLEEKTTLKLGGSQLPGKLDKIAK